MEQRWIPVEDRLPEKYGSYLVAWKPCNMSAAYVVKRSGVPHYYEILEYDPNDESGWIESIEQATGEYEILAWMPLPEPYRGEEPKQTNADRIRNMTDDKELESHDEKHTLECCISLMQELVNEFAEWYRWQHGEDAIEELDEEERFCFRKSYFRIVQELFLLGTNHSGGTSTRAKCEQLGVDSSEEIEFDWSDEE